jgi:hypothetical protein
MSQRSLTKGLPGDQEILWYIQTTTIPVKKMKTLAGFLLMSLLCLICGPVFANTAVTFYDKDWDQVTFEVRVGNYGNPEQNPSQGTHTLQRGQSWQTSSNGENVWYRREADPIHHSGQMGGWTNQPVFPNSGPITINLG